MNEKHVKLVGIGGGAASGKTTLSTLVVSLLGSRAALISLDEYLLSDQSHGPFTRIDAKGQRFFDFNHPDSIDLTNVRRRIAELSNREDNTQYIIVEGIFALAYEDLRKLMSLRIYVHVDDDVRLGRKIVRNYEDRKKEPRVTLQNYLNSGKIGHDQYVSRTMKHADIIIDGQKNLEVNAKISVTLIRNFQRLFS